MAMGMHITSAVIQIKVISRLVMMLGLGKLIYKTLFTTLQVIVNRSYCSPRPYSCGSDIILFLPGKGIAAASLQQYHFLFIRNKLHYNACLAELKFMLRGGL